MSNFNTGDKVRVVREHTWRGVSYGTSECAVGDTGIVQNPYSDDVWGVSWDNRNVSSAIDGRCLSLVTEPVVDFADGREPATVEQYLDRARKWMVDNKTSGWSDPQSILAVATFIVQVEQG